MKIISIAYWNPEEVKLYNSANLSHDTHESVESAQAVCDLLRQRGFGGNRQFYPTRTEVQAMSDIAYDQWKEAH